MSTRSGQTRRRPDFAVRRILARENWECLVNGGPLHTVREKADAAARRAFHLLENGLYLFA